MKKVYFASDAHLGAHAHTDSILVEKKLVRWLESIKHDAAAVWFLGDMFDYWFEYKYVVPKGFTRFLGKLAELSDQGVEIHFFTGNHDVWMFDYLTKEIGATIHRETLTIDLLGKNFFLGHGDEVDYRTLRYRILYKIFRSKICQALYASIHPRWSSALALGLSFKSRKRGNTKPRTYKGEDDEYLIKFAKLHLKDNHNINFYVFGHCHIMLDLMLSKNTRICILGDWIHYFSYAVWDGTDFTLEQFEND